MTNEEISAVVSDLFRQAFPGMKNIENPGSAPTMMFAVRRPKLISDQRDKSILWMDGCFTFDESARSSLTPEKIRQMLLEPQA